MNATQIRKKNQILLLEIKKMTKNIAQIKNETEKKKKRKCGGAYILLSMWDKQTMYCWRNDRLSDANKKMESYEQ